MSSRANDASPVPAPEEAVSDMAVAAAAPLRLGLFENVNLLRAAAALGVVVFHVIAHGRWTSFPDQGPLNAFRVGWLGVDLFFVISGFVIAYSALVLQCNDPEGFASQYWRRRLARILPLYFATLLLWVLFASPGFFQQPASLWTWQLLTHAAFVHSFWPETHGAIDGVNWSLAVEMQFYVAIALLLPWIARAPAWKVWLYGTLVAIAWRAGMQLAYGDDGLLFLRTEQLPGTLDRFAAGIYLAKRVIEGRTSGAREAAWWIGGAAIAGWLSMALYWRYSGYWDVPAMVIFWRSLFAVFLLCVVAAAVTLPQSLATRWLRPVNYLGEISYGIYLWHLFAVQYAIHYMGFRGGTALVVVVTLTIAAAAASWHGLEKPVMRWARLRPAPRP